mgnify:CR=1 FL=1
MLFDFFVLFELFNSNSFIHLNFAIKFFFVFIVIFSVHVGLELKIFKFCFLNLSFIFQSGVLFLNVSFTFRNVLFSISLSFSLEITNGLFMSLHNLKFHFFFIPLSFLFQLFNISNKFIIPIFLLFQFLLTIGLSVFKII